MRNKQRLEKVKNLIPYKKYGCLFRLIEVTDAKFIIELRTDEHLSRFLKKTNPSIEEQMLWIEQYKTRENNGTEFYFINIDKDDKTPIGLNRISNIEENEFELGSWLYKPQKNSNMPVLGDLAIRDIGYEILNLITCKFMVRKLNKSVVNYHQSFKPEVIGEDDVYLYFKLDYINYKNQRDKLLKILGYDRY